MKFNELFSIRQVFYHIFLLFFLSFSSVFSESIDSIGTPIEYNFQQTLIYQYHGNYNAKYSGKNSLINTEEDHTSLTSTLNLSFTPFNNTIITVAPELAGGRGLSSVRGIAGFPNGEIVRVGDPTPTGYFSKYNIKQIFYLGNKLDKDNSPIDTNNILVSIGKISILDYFDQNICTGDSREKFMNWALLANGAWDYSADTRGYTYGIVAEYLLKSYSFKAAFSLVPTEANGAIFDHNISKAHSITLEVGKQYSLFGTTGRVSILGYQNNTHAGNFNSFIANNDTNISQSRNYANPKYGIGINIANETSKDLRLFLKASWNNGQSESWMFTQIDRAFSCGGILKASFIGRANDDIGFALMVNGLSNEHKNFLQHGGYGFIIGDGNINYSPEIIIEIYYGASLFKHFNLDFDYQYIVNPAYNSDRGPVNVFSVRSHL